MSQLVSRHVRSGSRVRLSLMIGVLAVMSALATAGAASAQSFTDDFEGATINPFWSATQQSGTVGLSTDTSKSGFQSVKFTSPSGCCQRNVLLTHSFALATKGTLSVWFYDSGPGTTLYSGIYAFDSGPAQTDFHVNVADWNGSTYAWGGAGVSETATAVSRTAGWHQFTLQVAATGYTALIDQTVVGSVPGDLAFGFSGPAALRPGRDAGVRVLLRRLPLHPAAQRSSDEGRVQGRRLAASRAGRRYRLQEPRSLRQLREHRQVGPASRRLIRGAGLQAFAAGRALGRGVRRRVRGTPLLAFRAIRRARSGRRQSGSGARPRSRPEHRSARLKQAWPGSGLMRAGRVGRFFNPQGRQCRPGPCWRFGSFLPRLPVLPVEVFCRWGAGFSSNGGRIPHAYLNPSPPTPGRVRAPGRGRRRVPAAARRRQAHRPHRRQAQPSARACTSSAPARCCCRRR